MNKLDFEDFYPMKQEAEYHLMSEKSVKGNRCKLPEIWLWCILWAHRQTQTRHRISWAHRSPCFCLWKIKLPISLVPCKKLSATKGCHETPPHDLPVHQGTEIGLALNVASVPSESTEDGELQVPPCASWITPGAKQSFALWECYTSQYTSCNTVCCNFWSWHDFCVSSLPWFLSHSLQSLSAHCFCSFSTSVWKYYFNLMVSNVRMRILKKTETPHSLNVFLMCVYFQNHHIHT